MADSFCDCFIVMPQKLAWFQFWCARFEVLILKRFPTKKMQCSLPKKMRSVDPQVPQLGTRKYGAVI